MGRWGSFTPASTVLRGGAKDLRFTICYDLVGLGAPQMPEAGGEVSGGEGHGDLEAL